MARASAKRAKRARSNARNAQRAVAQEAAVAAPAAEEPVRTPKAEPKRDAAAPKQATARRSLLPRREKTPPKAKRPEDTMFFTRLRTRAKWVFVLLVAVFAIGFLAFGVGAGGTGVGDAIRDFFGGDSGTVSRSDLEKKVAENPADAEAVSQLSSLLASQNQLGQATSVLTTYLKANPNDADILQQLAALYDARALDTSRQAAAQQAAAFQGSFASSAFSFPSSNGFFGALGQDPIDQALVSSQRGEANDLVEQGTRLFAQEADTLDRLIKLRPDDANLYAQLGSAAQQASQTDPDQRTRAIAAYEKYLELEPEGALAQQVQEALNGLKAAEEASSSDVVQG